MNRWLVGVITGGAALAITIPIMLVLFLRPVNVEYLPGGGSDNMAPSDLQALTVHDRLAIQLFWTPVDQGTATYVLQRFEGDGESWVDVGELAPGSNGYMDGDGLKDGVTYSYRIYAHDPDGGSGYSSATSAMATALPEPQY